MLFYCGIDLHAKESVLCIIDTQDTIHFRDKIPNQINRIHEVLDLFTVLSHSLNINIASGYVDSPLPLKC